MLEFSLNRPTTNILYYICLNCFNDYIYSSWMLMQELCEKGKGGIFVGREVLLKAKVEEKGSVSVQYMCFKDGVLYNWLIWRVFKLVFFSRKIFSLYLFWHLEQSEQRHLYEYILKLYFNAIFNLALIGICQKTPN